jgi:DNA-binding response OmpR family regulator
MLGLGCAMRILLLEDHKRLSQSIVEGLCKFGFGVDSFFTAEGGVGAIKSRAYDAMILDLGLPDRDGLDLISELRGSNVSLPILILTARDTVDDRVTGLDRGADDYLAKPFAMTELAARLRALLRRPGRALGDVLESANITLNTALRQVEVDGRVVAISPREIGALELLMRRAGQVVSKRALEDTLYGLAAEDVNPNTVEVLISRLRKRLEEIGARCTIDTLRGIGYLLRE